MQLNHFMINGKHSSLFVQGASDEESFFPPLAPGPVFAKLFTAINSVP